MNTKLVENKNLYKLFLSVVKYTPLTVAIIHTTALIFHYFGIQAVLLSCIGGISILFIIMLYIISYVFKFCYLYRVPLWYLSIILSVNILRSIGLLSLQLLGLYRLYAIVFGIFILVFIIYMYKNRKNPKIDYIKQLCDRYTNCIC